VFGAQAGFVVTDILSDRGARAASFGLENPLATRVWSAAKTGTSKDMRDNWCVGFTSRYTVGVWVGNFSGAPMHDVSGVTGAAPIWRDLIHRLHATEPSVAPLAPNGLIEQEVAFEPAVETERDEWFVPGTQTRLVAIAAGANAGSAVTPHIRYPAPETIIALDPDIADDHQRVVFQASPVLPGMRWRIGGTELADVRGRAVWSPLPGTYTLLLESADGQALSSVPFEVRGNIAR
jgi:penicillin-binding protein 1C